MLEIYCSEIQAKSFLKFLLQTAPYKMAVNKISCNIDITKNALDLLSRLSKLMIILYRFNLLKYTLMGN